MAEVNPSVVRMMSGNDGNFNPQELNRGLGVRVMQFLDRTILARAFGVSFNGKRNLWDSFGWDTKLNLQMIMDMYIRGGISKRIVDAKPDSTWGRPPRIYLPPLQQQPATIQPTGDIVSLDPNLQWTRDFYKLAWDLDLWSYLKKVDILASLGRYAILLIGTNRGNVSQPLPRGGAGALKITYLQPYAETQVNIKSWETNPNDPRFGLPTMYTITNINSIRQLNTTGTVEPDVRPQGQSFDVHWSRVIHVAKNALTNSVFGVPDYAPIWNYLTDLQKVIGASSESYWRNAYPGLHMNVDKDMDLDEEDEENITAELDEFQHDMRRYMRTRGVEVNAISSKIADPRGSYGVLIDLISGTTGIPQRILKGSEAGQLASSQDKANWAERIEEYRETHAEPNLVWPFVMWVINNGILPLPANAEVQMLRALWPDAYRQSPLERGQTAAQTARSMANIVKGLQPIELEPAVDAVPAQPAQPATTDPITGKVTPAKPAVPGTPGKPAVTAEPIINRDEARRILGLSTDQQLLTQFPEDLG